MVNNDILYSKKGHVGYITLNRPQEGNRIDLSMSRELEAICQQIKGDEDIYLTIINGVGGHFCSGAEIINNDFEAGFSQNPAEALAALDCPVIAAIDGDAIAEGLELALACDLRIASETSRFGLPQVISGLIPMNGGTQRLSRIAGKGKALEMILTGETIDAKTALEIGLVTKVFSRDQLASELEKIVESLVAKAPFALRYCKEAINKGLDVTLEQGLRLEADLYFLLHTTDDRTEGIKAFTQKRPPEYKGR
jgi:enoyl-CoA hydratase/carnithine racemase